MVFGGEKSAENISVKQKSFELQSKRNANPSIIKCIHPLQKNSKHAPDSYTGFLRLQALPNLPHFHILGGTECTRCTPKITYNVPFSCTVSFI